MKLIHKQLAYFYNNVCWAVSSPRRLTTVSNMNLEEELGESLIVQTGNGSKIKDIFKEETHSWLQKWWDTVYQFISRWFRHPQLVWFPRVTYRIDPVPESTLKNIRAVSSRIWNTSRALWLRSLSVAWMTRGLPSSPRTTLLTGAASLMAPTYLLR